MKHRALTIFKYLSKKRAQDVLDNGKIGFTRVSHLNDPYESDFRTLLEISIEDIPNNVKDQYDISEDTAKLTHWKQLKEEFVVFCGSRIDDSVLMWSHYADNHKGVVIGFGETASFMGEPYFGKYDEEIVRNERGEIAPYSKTAIVQYSLIKPILKLGMPTIEPLRWKSACWSYEEEIRVVKHLPSSREDDFEGGILEPFENEHIFVILFGARFTQDEIGRWYYRYSQRYPNARFGQMKLCDDDYRLKRQPIISNNYSSPYIKEAH